jgi:hypothetical protein
MTNTEGASMKSFFVVGGVAILLIAGAGFIWNRMHENHYG